MSEMVDKVAKALSIADGFHPEACSSDEDDTPAWHLYVSMARAAIEAMREPTETMWEAVMDSPSRLRRSDWRDMIDAALSK